ncbi:hypothetical protein, partial [Formosimonas limnophila]|uniref:hypothetical protein n=1 Tax=Formosimonas limnophila TaxID=1384487 RepID=UPI0016784C23
MKSVWNCIGMKKTSLLASLLISAGIVELSYANEVNAASLNPEDLSSLDDKHSVSPNSVSLASASNDMSSNEKAVVRPLNKVLNLPEKGKIWVTEDPAVITPNLSVSAPSSVGFSDGKVAEPVLFNVYTNYAPFIEKAEVLVYAPEDVDRTKPAAVIPVKWDP